MLVPVQRTAGSRQDLATEGAAAVFWNHRCILVEFVSLSSLTIALTHLHIFRYYIEFLDECLRGNNKGNILQENLFIVSTSSEMVALCHSLAILHYTVCMPMRWLAGNKHFLGRCGFEWSAHSMGKAIDALETAMNDIMADGSFFLNEKYI